MTDLLDTNAVPTLSLEAWRQFFNLSPWHFWGMSNATAPNTRRNGGGCDSMVRQYAWQDSDAASRSEIARAIAEAEQMLATELNYAPLPRYTEFVLPWPRRPDLRFRSPHYADVSGRRLSVETPEGYLIALGVEVIALLGTVTTDPAGGLAYADNDGDGLLDTFTVTLTVPADTDPATIAVYVSATDRFDGSDRSARWRIQPIRASLSNTTLTVIGRAWACVRPILYEGMPTTTPSGGGGNGGLDPTDASIYLDALEICTRTTDPNGETADTSQAVLEWDTRPAYLDGWCLGTTFPGTNSADPAAVARVVARAGIRNAHLGHVIPAAAVRNATSGVWSETWPSSWRPDRVIVRAYAGRTDVVHDMTRAICLLSAALLARPICACADTNRELYYQQFDLTLAGRQDELYSTRDPDLDNPFGPRRGAVGAWKTIKRRQLTRPVWFG